MFTNKGIAGFVIAVVLLANSQNVFSKVRMPVLFTDNMVLQRDKPIHIWGWADRGEGVAVEFNGDRMRTKADKQGRWYITLNPMVYGGPYEMVITGHTDKLLLKNILIGDVWVCSGQSNMEMPLKGYNNRPVKNAVEEIRTAQYPGIRMFTVDRESSYLPRQDLKGGMWKECTPENVPSFSATGYFFGRDLNQDLNVPIGLINSSWGGTIIQAWISWDEMKQQKGIVWKDDYARYETALAGEVGLKEKWYKPTTSVTGWSKTTLPATFEQSEVGNVDGIVWYRKDMRLTSSQAAAAGELSLGAIDDFDETYVNGQLVGKTSNWSIRRKYIVNKGLLHAGNNSIVVRIQDKGVTGGFTGKKADLYLAVGTDTLTLAGPWLYRATVTTSGLDIKDTGPNAFPSQLYNAMIAPFIRYSIKGIIWYQGENNVAHAYSYRTLFPLLINDWRRKWGEELPFIWVQLANFRKPAQQPSGSAWAELREAQHTTLSLPNTGEAVIIDAGEADDIHPIDKQTVGHRLALAALHQVYRRDVVSAGPKFQSMEIKGGTIELTFDCKGADLVAKGDRYGYLKGFTLAGEDKKFVWAKARIEGDRVVVFNETVRFPVAVRYAWADNPDDANLFNQAGLPASPFRTDTWPGITD